MIFETERLTIDKLKDKDKDYFVELLTDPKIIDPGSHQKTDMDEVLRKFQLNLRPYIHPIKNQENIWGVFEKENSEMIGISAVSTNDEGGWEIGYRFRVQYWKHGFGTELANGMIKYCFKELKFKKITADVDVKNTASVKILEKIMLLEKEFYNQEDRCVDRRYKIEIKQWLQQNV